MGEELAILIVDDEANQRKVLSDILKQKGYAPASLAEGESALAWAKEKKPAVALVDLKLADISGLKVLQGIREHSPETSCIILTGHGSENIAGQVVNEGAYGYLKKPYDIEQLLLMIHRAVEQQRSDRMLRETNRRLKISIEQMPTAYIVWDVKGRIQEWNQAARRIFGYTKEEALGKQLVELVVSKTSRVVVKDIMETLLAGGTANYSEENKNIRKDGTPISCEWWSVPLTGSDGRIYAVLSVALDVTQRMQVEAERRRLALAVENTDEVVFMTDPDGTMNFVNSAFEKVYGFSRQEALGKTPHILSSGEMSPEFHEDFWTILRAGKVCKCEFLNRSKEGKPIVAETTINPILDAARKLAGYVVVQRDITQQAQERKRLRASEERFQSVFQESAVPLWEKDLSEVVTFIAGVKEGGGRDFRKYLDEHPETLVQAAARIRITGFNKAILKLHEAQSAEELRSGLPTIFTEAVHKSFKEELIALAEGRPSAQFETRLKTLAGAVKDLDVKCIFLPGPDGSPGRALVSTVDITARKQTEMTLRESEERYRSVVQSSASAVIVADQELKVVAWNPSAGKMFGYQEQEVVGQPVIQLFPQRYREDFRSRIQRYCSGDACGLVGQLVEVHGLKKDGSEVPVEMSQSCWLTEGGRCFSIIMRDLSEKELLKEQLLHAQKMEAVGILAGGVAHDFNNILTGINGLSSLALEEAKSDSTVYDDLKEIRELGERAAGLTRQLLAFSRQLPPEVTPLNLDSLIQNLLKMLTRVIGEDIELKFMCHAESEMIRADAGQVEQVLMNLAVNARDAMPQGGTLTIGTERVELSSARGEVPAGIYVTLTVSDSGCGMDAETCSRIFDPFYTTKEVGQGTGLGLSTVYGIVNQHEGHIEVKSTPGEGTDFTIYLPVATEEAGESAPANESREEGEKSEVILLAEDDKTVRGFVERVLQKEGFTLHVAADPAQARLLFEEHRREIGLLIADVIMPGGNGPDLYQALADRKPQLKVLFISGYTGETSRITKIRARGLPFLAKPFDPEDLVKKVEAVLRGGLEEDTRAGGDWVRTAELEMKDAHGATGILEGGFKP